MEALQSGNSCSGHHTHSTPIASSQEPAVNVRMDELSFCGAIRRNFVDECLRRLQDGLDVTQEFDEDFTALHWACIQGKDDTVLVTSIIKGGVDVNASGPRSETPLHWAAFKGHVFVVAALLANGAEPNALDSSGFSPLARAIQGKHDATIKVLLANGASAMTGGGAEYGSPVFWSVIGNEPIIIETLVRGSNAYAPCSVNLRSPSGLTLLHVASKCGNMNAVVTLLQFYADVHAKTHEGKTASQLAEENGHSEIASVLKSCEKAGEVYTWMRYRMKEHQPVFMTFGLCVSVVAIVLIGFPFRDVFPDTLLLKTVFMTCGFAACYLMIKGCRTSPGVVPAGTIDAKELLNYEKVAKRVCFTCMAEKPLRSKHSSISNRCVERFDHYCAWINNDVGLNNHHVFYGYLVSVLIALTIMVYFCICLPIYYPPMPEAMSMSVYLHRLFVEHTWMFILLVLYVIFALFVAVLFVDHTRMMLSNTNTNESLNWHRYELFRDHLNNYYNPYDRGVIENLKEFWTNCQRSTVYIPEEVRLLARKL